MKLVCISDTHGSHGELSLPAGDVLVHAGDVMAHGNEADAIDFLQWFGSQPHPHKLFIAGNHDWFAQNQPERMRELAEAAGVVWLDDTGIECDGVKFWGSPITLRFHDWAFMRDPGSDIEKHWALIPENTDVLITHGPPFGILDRVQRLDGTEEQTGCPQLLKHIQRIKPKLHVFGHIHEEYGKLDRYGTEFLNTSSMDISYRIANAPVVRLL